MNTQVAVSSVAINKNTNKSDFQKYNIEVSIEEIENNITSNRLKYRLTLLSDPKNVRLSVEGTVEISGNEAECIKALEKDENGIPRVLHLIYQDLFPTFFMTTKIVGAPCPAYRLSQVSAPSEILDSPISEEQPEVETMQEQPAAKDKPEEPEVEAIPEQPDAEAKPEQPEVEIAQKHSPHILQPDAEAKPEQPEIAQVEPAATGEKKPEEMNLDELNQLYSNLSSEYQNNPSGEIGEKLQKVSELIQKRQQEQMVTETSM